MQAYLTYKQIKAKFPCGDSTIRECRRYIADHPERYTAIGVIRNLTNVFCFVDAYKYRGCEDTSLLPPFDPREAEQLLGEVDYVSRS